MSLGETHAAPDRDAVPQPRQHGRRGVDPRQSDRRRRAADGLRQDHAGAADGRGELSTCRPSASPAGRCSTASSAASDIGSGTGVWQMSEEVRAGKMTLRGVPRGRERACTARHGHCMTMGTASTMACMVEALGIGLPGNAAIPAVDARRNVLARMAGPAHRRDGARGSAAVEDPHARRRSRTRSALNAAIGGSTNAVIHLLAHRRAHRRRARRSTTGTGSAASVPCLVDLHAVGQVPDGGLLLRRRPAGGDAGDLATRCCTGTRSPSTARRSARTSPTRRAGTAR